MRAPRRRSAEPRRCASSTPICAFGRRPKRRGTAYGGDLAHFAQWCAARGLEPAAVDARVLRRYAAQRSQEGLSPASLARSVASLRSFYRMLREHGLVASNPAELLTLPKRPRSLPHVLRPQELAQLLDRIPQTTPLELRDRAMLELAYACGLRAEELVTLATGSVDFDAEQLRIEGKGSKTRFVPVGEPALRALTRYLERGRPALAPRRRACVAPVEVGAPALDLGCAPAPADLVNARRAGRRDPSARAPALVRHPPAQRRRRSARDPGAAWPFEHFDDTGLHSSRVCAAEARLREQSSASVAGSVSRIPGVLCRRT